MMVVLFRPIFGFDLGVVVFVTVVGDVDAVDAVDVAILGKAKKERGKSGLPSFQMYFSKVI